MPLVRGTQQQHRGVHRAARHHHDVGAEARLRSVLHRRDDLGDRAAAGVGLQPADIGTGDHLHVVVPQGGVDTDHLRVRLAAEQAGEAVHPVAADAHAVVGGAALRVLDEVHPDRQVEGVQPVVREVLAELLDPRLVLHRRVGVLRADGSLARVLAVPAVHEVEVFRLGVVRLQVRVADRPGGREPAVVAQHAEVLGAQPEQRGAVELGVPADVIVDLGREPVTVFVVPELRCPVLALDEDRVDSQLSRSRGRYPPRSRIRMRFPLGARRWAMVPPPAPVPMTMTSYRWLSAMAATLLSMVWGCPPSDRRSEDGDGVDR